MVGYGEIDVEVGGARMGDRAGTARWQAPCGKKRGKHTKKKEEEVKRQAGVGQAVRQTTQVGLFPCFEDAAL